MALISGAFMSNFIMVLLVENMPSLHFMCCACVLVQTGCIPTTWAVCTQRTLQNCD